MSDRSDCPHLTGPSSYFYLSYAHSPPLAGTLQADSDRWVRKFCRDLTESVDRIASPPRLAPGFLDQDIPPNANWKASLTRALGTAEVFVPLLSPGYFSRSWPGREWACYAQRLKDARITGASRRFLPVLWIPLPRQQDRPELRDALALGESERGYAENGLRAMLRLAPYRGSYRLILERLARQIVDLAQGALIGPTEAPDIGDVQSAFPPRAKAAVFAVAVAAPALADVPVSHDRVGYGNRGADWRAYPDDQVLPLSEYAAQVAEQLDFAVVLADIEKTGKLPGNMPGVVLIDPWFAADNRGLDTLRSFAGGLQHWVLPLLILDPFADARVIELADTIKAILGASAATQTETAKIAIKGVASLKELVSLMPVLVAEAKRQFLRRGPVERSTAQPGSRLRLAGDGKPVSPAPATPAAEKDV